MSCSFATMTTSVIHPIYKTLKIKYSPSFNPQHQAYKPLKQTSETFSVMVKKSQTLKKLLGVLIIAMCLLFAQHTSKSSTQMISFNLYYNPLWLDNVIYPHVINMQLESREVKLPQITKTISGRAGLQILALSVYALNYPLQSSQC